MQSQPLADIEADWPRLSGLLDEIMNLPPASRETFIGALPPPDDRLADTLRELLALQAKVETEAFMDDLPVFPGLLPEPLSGGAASALLSEGTEVGPYRLLRPIGEGGMGAVWLAERTDGTLKRKVALKLPRLAWAQDLAVRMARERDILAGLEHPNIARLYDAGVDAVGRPWLAIEYVEGRDLTAFCDTARLDLRARVRLFLQVLEAVQYAHGNLVIHRDLKPANILVTPRGEARLLDFGIARLEEGAVEAGPDLTRTGASAMTPRYASPEQVQGARLTVASDLYSLGVVLHELLTGETPYVLRRESRAEYEQAIVESDLRVPSRLKVTEVAAAARGTTPERIARDLRGDLDAVLLRALARAPAARYASAAAFRDDLERWLEGRTVTALPPSRLHSLRKFVARNRLAVAASAAAVLALVAVSVVAVLQAQRATRSAELARAETAKANATNEFLLSIFRRADPTERGGRDATAKELLSEAESQLDAKVLSDPRLKADILGTLDSVWLNLGEPRRAQAVLEKRTPMLLSEGDTEGAADSILREAERAITARAFDEVKAKLERVRLLIDIDNADPLLRGRFHYLEAALLNERGERDAALITASKAVAASRAADDPSTLFNSLLLRTYVRRATGDPRTVRQDVDEALSLMDGAVGRPIEQVGGRYQVAVARYLLGDYARGWPEIQRVIAETEALQGSFSPGMRPERGYWIRYCLRLGEAELSEKWIERWRFASPVDSRSTFESDPRWRLLIARVFMAKGHWDKMNGEIAAARALLPRATGAELETEKLTAQVRLLEAEGLLRRGDARAAIRMSDGKMPDSSADLVFDRYWIRGNAARLVGDIRGAETELRAAVSVAEKTLGNSHPLVALIKMDLALSLALTKGDGDTAVSTLVASAAPIIASSFPSDHSAMRKIKSLGILDATLRVVDGATLRRRLAEVNPRLSFM
jgi:eukaryotic-like serine/threonine-protein kinase